GREQVATGSPANRNGFEFFQDLVEGGAAEVGHDQDAAVGGAVVVDGVQRHDVRVLEPGQRQVLAAQAGGDLEDDAAARQARLRRQVDAALTAPTQRFQDLVLAQELAGPRQVVQRRV